MAKTNIKVKLKTGVIAGDYVTVSNAKYDKDKLESVMSEQEALDHAVRQMVESRDPELFMALFDYAWDT